MAIINLSFLAGVFAIFYISALLLFAILRIFTGVSIQRIGFTGLRRIGYSLRDGTRLEIRGLGLRVHRPTFSQPTWISLVITELSVSIDPTKLQPPASKGSATIPKDSPVGAECAPATANAVPKSTEKPNVWLRLTNVKNRIKQLQGAITWLQFLDVVAYRTSVNVVGVGSFEVGSFLLQVDTRKNTVDRSKLFQHNPKKTEQLPAEWTLVFRTICFVADGGEPEELLDYGVLNVHGFLNPKLAGLRDASLSIKVGRLHLPYDLLNNAFTKIKSLRPASAEIDKLSLLEVRDRPIEPQEALLSTLKDAKNFLDSTIHGIRDVSLLVAFIGTSIRVDYVRPGGFPLYLNMSMREIGLDIHRVDSNTPAHSMYFAREDIAHEALLSALAFSLGIDDGHDGLERLIYVPMTTATVRTTSLGKLVEYAEKEGNLDLNTNLLLANLVITSPSVDLDPGHLPVLLAVQLNRANNKPVQKSKRSFGSAYQLLPKLSMKLLIHEPVVRVALPPVHQSKDQSGYDFDLIISAISSVSFEIDASHSSDQAHRYAVLANMRVLSQKLYYQTRSRETQDLLILESMEVKARMVAAPAITVSISGSIQTMSFFMVRTEMSQAIRQIVKQLRSDVISEKAGHTKKVRDPNFVRALPEWLDHVDLQANDLTLEVAGLDPKVSSLSRGVAVHIETWSAAYKAHQVDSAEEPTKRRPTISRRRKTSQSTFLVDEMQRSSTVHAQEQKPLNRGTDGRRIAVHLKGFEAFVMDGVDVWETKPFIILTRSEVALSTSHDDHGPIFHINCHTKAFNVYYSLFRYYSLGVAALVLQETFARHQRAASEHIAGAPKSQSIETKTDINLPEGQPGRPEFMAIDVKIPFVQFKAKLPSNPDLMLHLEGLEGGIRRFTHPHIHAKNLRLYASSPTVRNAWSKVVSIKTPRVDLREMHLARKGTLSTEKSIDFVSDVFRIGIPHQLIVHHIFDNVVNTIKTTSQLNHRFKTSSEEYILAKHPEGPKHVPKVTIRTQVLLFEIEDGPFEWKLGCIYRTGLIEQKQRIAREEAFKLKSEMCAKGSSKLHPDMTYRTSPRRSSDKGRETCPNRRSSSPSQRRSSTSRERVPRQTSKSSPVQGYGLRYDRRGTCNVSGKAQVSTGKAREALHVYNAQSWRKRIDSAFKYQMSAVQEVRDTLWGSDTTTHEYNHGETILQIPHRPALMQILMSDLHVSIDKPTFPLSHLPDFMHDVGKGLPKDTKFGLLIPMHLSLEMGETRMALRDYPLPLVHIPAIQPGRSPRTPSWSLKTNFIIAEEYRNFESTRDLKITVIPPDKMKADKHAQGFAVDVRRTVSPVKTYSDMKVEINTTQDTRFTWGSSYQPAIQHMMQTIEGFSKPQLDPSDRVGFWDKLRLSFHSRINVAWKNDGDVHLRLKGTRDPYIVVGHGAGLLMVWRNNVQWNIGQDPDPKAFMSVDSGDYLLAVPDYGADARSTPDSATAQAQQQTISSHQREQKLKKVIMKLSGKVRWQVGMVFERDVSGGTRSFDFIPHYDVTLRNPVHIKSIQNEEDYDAFRGFRSNHIHMSISIIAPSDRKWSVENIEPSKNYNAVHLSPRFFTHFFAWWSMFSGVMSLPVHQGKLFPGVDKSGKKFGRHLATIKYSLLFSPLYIAHVYKHKDAEEWSDDAVSVTGLKFRLDSFILDLHQRREEFTREVKGLNKHVKTSGMRINQALLDLVGADVRAVSALLSGTGLTSVQNATEEQIRSFSDAPAVVDLSTIQIPDNDFRWVDADDFVEIDWTLPVTAAPKTKILPLAYAPRFTYRRQTDHGDNIHGDENRSSNFGHEQTHHCLMSSGNDPRAVQIRVIKGRLDNIDHLLEKHKAAMDEQHLTSIKDVDDSRPETKKLEQLREHGNILRSKRAFVKRMLDEMQHRMENTHRNSTTPSRSETPASSERGSYPGSHHAGTNGTSSETDASGIDLSSMPDYVSDFNNRFVVHNAQIKWNNSLRNIMLRYVHQVTQRRGFVYYTSRRAVKFILDIIEDQQKTKRQTDSPVKDGHTTDSRSPAEAPDDGDGDDELDIQARINQLLKDGNNFVHADDKDDDTNRQASTAGTAAEDVAQNFTPQNSYHLRLIAPQVQLQSEKNTKAVVLVTARGMRLKVLQIMDKKRVDDDVSGLVQTRFAAEMDNMQFFVTTKQSLSPQFLKLFAGNLYGATAGSAWPPWAPIEAMFDFSVNTYGFQRVVQRTSASLRFDKFNNLRLKYNDNVNNQESRHLDSSGDAQSRMDHLWVDFPQIRAICDSTQYYAIYVIVLDLLMWSEPLEKTRHERLEKIMLASDFSDFTGAPELVIQLQDRMRNLNEIKQHFHTHETRLDRKGWEDRISLEQDLAGCEEELFFIMKAITTSQQKVDERAVETSGGNGTMKWFLSATEIVWHLIKEVDKPLAEFQLHKATYERTDNSDGSNLNALEIDRLYGVSLLKDSIYPEIIAAYNEQDAGKRLKMLQVRWLKLEAIAGINVVDHFEVNLFPLRIQLEYETGKQLFEYVFPGMNKNEEGFSPLMVRNKLPAPEDDDEFGSDAATAARDRQASMELASNQRHAAGYAAGAGPLENRLRPTYKLPERTVPSSPSPQKAKPKNPVNLLGQHRSIFASGSKSSLQSSAVPSARTSSDNLSMTYRGRPSSITSTTTTSQDQNGHQGIRHRFSIKKIMHRSSSTDSRPESQHGRESKEPKNKKDKEKNTDDLTQMLNRASNYMTLAYVKIPSVVLCLSYKGKGHRNFEDVHGLVFRMPTLEYRNKTWSNLDLALALKKDVIRALISHTGAIIGNKLTHHKPARQQIDRLQQLARSSAVMSSNEISRINSTTSSILPFEEFEENPRTSDMLDDMTDYDANASIPSTHDFDVGDERPELRPRLASHLSNLTAKSREASHPVQKLTHGLSAVAHLGRRRDTVGSDKGLEKRNTTEKSEDADSEREHGGVRKEMGLLKKKLLGR